MEFLESFLDILLHTDRLIQVGGLTLLLVIVFLETGVVIGFIFAGDALLFTAGLLCGTKALDVNVYLLVLLVALAAILGNITGYFTGSYLGKRLFQKKETLFFKQRHLDKTNAYYEKYGAISLIAGRFIPIVRTFVPILAGAIRMNFWKFNIYNVSGAFIWSGSLIPFGYFLGKRIPNASDYLEYFVIGITAITMTILIRGYLKFRKGNF